MLRMGAQLVGIAGGQRFAEQMVTGRALGMAQLSCAQPSSCTGCIGGVA